MIAKFYLTKEKTTKAIDSFKLLDQLPQPTNSTRTVKVTRYAMSVEYHNHQGQMIFGYLGKIDAISGGSDWAYYGSRRDFGCGDIGTLNGVQQHANVEYID